MARWAPVATSVTHTCSRFLRQVLHSAVSFLQSGRGPNRPVASFNSIHSLYFLRLMGARLPHFIFSKLSRKLWFTITYSYKKTNSLHRPLHLRDSHVPREAIACFRFWLHREPVRLHRVFDGQEEGLLAKRLHELWQDHLLHHVDPRIYYRNLQTQVTKERLPLASFAYGNVVPFMDFAIGWSCWHLGAIKLE